MAYSISGLMMFMAAKRLYHYISLKHIRISTYTGFSMFFPVSFLYIFPIYLSMVYSQISLPFKWIYNDIYIYTLIQIFPYIFPNIFPIYFLYISTIYTRCPYHYHLTNSSLGSKFWTSRRGAMTWCGVVQRLVQKWPWPCNCVW